MNRNILILLAAVAIAVMVTLMLLKDTNQFEVSSVNDLLFPELKHNLDKIKLIEITTANTKIELSNENDKWLVANHYNYPADFSKVSHLLSSLSSTKFIEAKTKKPENYNRLGVEAIEAENTNSVLVSLFFKNTSYRVLVGKYAENWDGHFIRFPDDIQAWLVDKEIPIQPDIKSWLDPEIINLNPERVQQVSFIPPEGASLVVQKQTPEQMHYTIQNLPQDKQLAYEDAPDGVAQILAYLIHENVLPANAIQFEPTVSHTVKVKCFDGLEVTIKTMQYGDKYYAVFRADVGTGVGIKAESEAVNQNSEKINIEQEVGQLNEQLSPWVFEIGEYVYKDFTRKLDDWLASSEPPSLQNRFPEFNKH